MVFLSEFVTYAIKYVALGLIAFLGIMCGIRYKKNKIAKEAASATKETDEQIEK